jgi:hypothetical protein
MIFMAISDGSIDRPGPIHMNRNGQAGPALPPDIARKHQGAKTARRSAGLSCRASEWRMGGCHRGKADQVEICELVGQQFHRDGSGNERAPTGVHGLTHHRAKGARRQQCCRRQRLSAPGAPHKRRAPFRTQPCATTAPTATRSRHKCRPAGSGQGATGGPCRHPLACPRGPRGDLGGKRPMRRYGIAATTCRQYARTWPPQPRDHASGPETPRSFIVSCHRQKRGARCMEGLVSVQTRPAR